MRVHDHVCIMVTIFSPVPARPEDILSDIGFIRHLWCTMNLAHGGLLAMGVVCSSWSIMSRALSEYDHISCMRECMFMCVGFLCTEVTQQVALRNSPWETSILAILYVQRFHHAALVFRFICDCVVEALLPALTYVSRARFSRLKLLVYRRCSASTSAYICIMPCMSMFLGVAFCICSASTSAYKHVYHACMPGIK